MNIFASFVLFLLLLLLSSGVAGADAASTTPPRLTSLALVFGETVNVTVVPTFDPDVTSYVANVSDAVFELAVGYTTEEGWEANVSVDVTVAPGVYVYSASNASSSTSSGNDNVTYANVTSNKVAIDRGANDLSVKLTRSNDVTSTTTYVITVVRLSLLTHASLIALSVSPGTLTPAPGESQQQKLHRFYFQAPPVCCSFFFFGFFFSTHHHASTTSLTHSCTHLSIRPFVSRRICRHDFGV